MIIHSSSKGCLKSDTYMWCPNFSCDNPSSEVCLLLLAPYRGVSISSQMERRTNNGSTKSNIKIRIVQPKQSLVLCEEETTNWKEEIRLQMPAKFLSPNSHKNKINFKWIKISWLMQKGTPSVGAIRFFCGMSLCGH
jgi:hypothetical protein